MTAKYTILKADTEESLVRLVNEHLKRGWGLYGITFFRDSAFFQPMVLRPHRGPARTPPPAMTPPPPMPEPPETVEYTKGSYPDRGSWYTSIMKALNPPVPPPPFPGNDGS